MPTSMLSLDFTDFTGQNDRISSCFKKSLRKAEDFLKTEFKNGTPSGRIEVSLVDDKVIREINKKYRGTDRPTDVVSLSWIDNQPFPGKDNNNLLGEIFISVDTAAMNAAEDGKTVDDELVFLFIHGVLHVFGYDHMNSRDEAVMFSLQKKILKQ